MDLLKTILLYLSMLYISSVQIAPDPSTVDVTPTPRPTAYVVAATATPEATPSPTPVPTPDITPNGAYGQLVMGDRGDDVLAIQQKLTELGYYTDKLDGAYGYRTRHAVELFQYQNGLTVDGIAGKYTQTVLFESDNVRPIPTALVVTPTPVFRLDDTATPPPATQTPAATPSATPSPTPTETPETTDTPAPAAVPDPNAAIPMTGYQFVISGFAAPLTVQDQETVLHPVEAGEILYVPLMEILKSEGSVVIENAQENAQELAFTVLTDFYRVSYTQNEDGALSDLVWEKNTVPQPLATRSAFLIDGVFYLPLEDVQRITGIEFTMDEAAGTITITMPTA